MGLDKPVLNVFRMFSHMTGRDAVGKRSCRATLEAILKEGVRGEPDIAAGWPAQPK